MTWYNFGKDISRQFFPLINELPVALPTQNPAIYLFRSYPTLNDARDGGGAAATITSWTQNASSPYDCTYTIPAIDDPDPESSIPQRTYYLAINFILQTSEQTQTVIQSIDIERASGTSEVSGTTSQDILDIYPAASNYASSTELLEYVNEASNDVALKLLAKNIRYSDIQNHRDLKSAICYTALVFLCRAQIANGGADKFLTLHDLYKEAAKEKLADIVLYVDVNRDGVPDVATQAKANYVITTR